MVTLELNEKMMIPSLVDMFIAVGAIVQVIKFFKLN